MKLGRKDGREAQERTESKKNEGMSEDLRKCVEKCEPWMQMREKWGIDRKGYRDERLSRSFCQSNCLTRWH
jgi:hypothetical protein